MTHQLHVKFNCTTVVSAAYRSVKLYVSNVQRCKSNVTPIYTTNTKITVTTDHHLLLPSL